MGPRQVQHPRRTRDDERRTAGIAAFELSAVGRGRIVQIVHVIGRVRSEWTARTAKIVGARIDRIDLVPTDRRSPAVGQQVVTRVRIGIVALKEDRVGRNPGALRDRAGELGDDHVRRVGRGTVASRFALHGDVGQLTGVRDELDVRPAFLQRGIMVGNQHLAGRDQGIIEILVGRIPTDPRPIVAGADEGWIGIRHQWADKGTRSTRRKDVARCKAVVAGGREVVDLDRQRRCRPQNQDPDRSKLSQ